MFDFGFNLLNYILRICVICYYDDFFNGFLIIEIEGVLMKCGINLDSCNFVDVNWDFFLCDNDCFFNLIDCLLDVEFGINEVLVLD